MCILFIAVNQHPSFPLIIAANRDEFHQRPTRSSRYWDAHEDVLAGKDEQAGGTWMGVTKAGKIAALTNIRAPGRELDAPITRGNLVLDWLVNKNGISAQDYRKHIGSERARYNGYNLLFGELDNLYVYNNFEDSFVHLEDGVFGLSNANLDSPWPKIMKGRDALAATCKQKGDLNVEGLFDILADNVKAEDQHLPQTGVPIEWERKLSSIFIKSPEYGTRSSTLLTLDTENKIDWQERVFDPDARLLETNTFSYQLDKT